jgi:hypothetical protein
MKEYRTESLTPLQLLYELKELPHTDWKLVSHTYMENVNMFHIILERDIPDKEDENTAHHHNPSE